MGKIRHSIKQEFRRERCGCEIDEPDDFFKSQWQSGSRNWLYLIYRWLLAVYFTFVIIYTMSGEYYYGQVFKYFIYLTNWGLILCLLTHLIAAVLVTIWHFAPESTDSLYSDSICAPVRIYWAFHSLTMTVSIVITLSYWILLYDPPNTPITPSNFMEHATNSIAMFLDLWIVAHPVRIAHIFLPILVGIIYPIFSYIYQMSGGTNALDEEAIYSVLDWNKPRSSLITLFSVILGMLIVFVLVFLMSKLRLLLYRSCQNSSTTVLPTTVNDTEKSVHRVHEIVHVNHITMQERGHENSAFTISNETIQRL